jgi:hypothetical protein
LLVLSIAVAAILMGGAREGIRRYRQHQAGQSRAYWQRRMDYHAQLKKGWLLKAAHASGPEATRYRDKAAKEADLEQICRMQF